MPRERNAPQGLAASQLDMRKELSKGEQIRSALEAFVRDSPPDTLIPSERVLAEQFKVARMTVRNAISALEAVRMVRRVPGRGAFVQHPRLAHSESFRSFTEDMLLRGMVPGARDFKARLKPAGRLIADNLGIAVGDEVFVVERVRTADGTPMAIERTNLPARRFPCLLDKMHADDSLYELLTVEYGIQLETAEQTVAIARLSAPDARRLGTAIDEPCFALSRRTHDNMGKIVEFGRSLYRGDRYVIEMHVKREK